MARISRPHASIDPKSQNAAWSPWKPIRKMLQITDLMSLARHVIDALICDFFFTVLEIEHSAFAHSYTPVLFF